MDKDQAIHRFRAAKSISTRHLVSGVAALIATVLAITAGYLVCALFSLALASFALSPLIQYLTYVDPHEERHVNFKQASHVRAHPPAVATNREPDANGTPTTDAP